MASLKNNVLTFGNNGAINLHYEYRTDYDNGLAALLNDLPASDYMVCGTVNIHGINYSFFGQKLSSSFASIIIQNYFGVCQQVYWTEGTIHKKDL